MNFLGHLALAWPDQNLMVGGFLGDFVKGPLKGVLPQEIETGIQLHRRIDAKSDCHPALQSLKSQLPKNWCRYAGILADLYCDHLISNPDSGLAPTPIGEFSESCYQILDDQRAFFPERAQLVFELMWRGRWLEKYSDLGFTIQSLDRIGTRLTFENPLANSEQIICDHANLLDQHCPSLYAGMQEVVAEWHAETGVQLSACNTSIQPRV